MPPAAVSIPTVTPAPPPPKETFAPVELDPDVMRDLRPIKYEGESPFQGRLHEIVGWDTWSMERKIAFMRRFVEDTSKDPAIAKKAGEILQAARVSVRDHRAAWAALLKWVQTNIRYENEPGERLCSPQYTLSTGGPADCDDLAILLAALGHSLRMPWRFVLSGRAKDGTKRRWVEGLGPCARDVVWSHIYLSVGWPPFAPRAWVWAEPTLRVPLGWDTMQGRAGRADMDGGGTGVGIAETVKQVLTPIPWKTIGTSVVSGVISFLIVDAIREARKKPAMR